MRPSRSAFLRWFAGQPASRPFISETGSVGDAYKGEESGCPLATYFCEEFDYRSGYVGLFSYCLGRGRVGKGRLCLPWMRIAQEAFFTADDYADTETLWETLPKSWTKSITANWEVMA